MSRYNDVITLLSSTERYQDEEAVWHDGEPAKKEVFCNRYSVGATTLAAYSQQGLRADAQVSVRTIDYDGQTEAEFDGVRYDVAGTSSKGEFTTLTLQRRAHNAT